MKTYNINGSEVQEGIAVVQKPYPHVVLGEGGNKQATWVPLGRRDARKITVDGKIENVGVITLRDKETREPTGKFLVVAPRNGKDNRVLVLWSVESGYRGSAQIWAVDEDVQILGYDHAWHSGQGAMGETAEMLAVLKPEQKLRAERGGRHLQNTHAYLAWDGRQIKVEFGDENLFAVMDYEEEEAEVDEAPQVLTTEEVLPKEEYMRIIEAGGGTSEALVDTLRMWLSELDIENIRGERLADLLVAMQLALAYGGRK